MRRTRHPASTAALPEATALKPRSRGTRAAQSADFEQVPSFDFARMSIHAGEPRRLEIAPLAGPDLAAPRLEPEIIPIKEGDGGEQAKDKPAEEPGPKCGEAINWTPDSPSPIEVTADSAADFASKMQQALGGVPHTQVEAEWNLESESGKVVKTNTEVKTRIVRARYGGGRASDAEKALIRRVVEFIKAHEERHRDIARAAYQKAVCDALGKGLTTANAVFERTRCVTEPDAQAALDASEGKIDWVTDASGAVVDFKAVGVKANYRPDDCKGNK
jgi:hypothetical protein